MKQPNVAQARMRRAIVPIILLSLLLVSCET
jgi:hypothetical protein